MRFRLETALSLPAEAFQTLTWRKGSNISLSGRFAALRVRHAGGNGGKARLRPLQWLLIEWPEHEAEPCKYILSTLPEDTPLIELVGNAYQRWRIERDYQELKQDFGLGHYEGRGWRGFHHHASLSIAAYGFLMSERLRFSRGIGGKKNFAERRLPEVPEDFQVRGSASSPASHAQLDPHTSPSSGLRTDGSTRAMPVLRTHKRKTHLVTQ